MTPRLEVLEDRCLPSVTSTVPAASDLPPVIAAANYFLSTLPKGYPTVVFVGDSISWEYIYGTGSGVWNAYMAPLGMSNYGIFGQTTQSLLYQLSLGQLAGITPTVVVLDIGANDLLQGNSPQDTAQGVLADVAMIHQYQPLSQVIVLGILPGMQSPTDPYRQEGEETNRLVRQMLEGDPKATYLDIGSMFVQPDGTISPSIMFDYLHPTGLGYLELTNVLLPILEQAILPTLNTGPLPSPGVPSASVPSSSVVFTPS
jgi:lysophospholipase L1-like esterase